MSLLLIFVRFLPLSGSLKYTTSGSAISRGHTLITLASINPWPQHHVHELVELESGGNCGVRMKAIVQRVTGAKVLGIVTKSRNLIYPLSTCTLVDGKLVSSIGKGMCVLLGISRDDTSREADWM